MKIVFKQPHRNAPTKLLANVDLRDIFPGRNIILRELAVWDGPDGPWVAVPAREYENKQGEKKKVWILTSGSDDFGDLDKLKRHILAEFEKWSPEADQEDNSFA